MPPGRNGFDEYLAKVGLARAIQQVGPQMRVPPPLEQRLRQEQIDHQSQLATSPPVMQLPPTAMHAILLNAQQDRQRQAEAQARMVGGSRPAVIAPNQMQPRPVTPYEAYAASNPNVAPPDPNAMMNARRDASQEVRARGGAIYNPQPIAPVNPNPMGNDARMQGMMDAASQGVTELPPTAMRAIMLNIEQDRQRKEAESTAVVRARLMAEAAPKQPRSPENKGGFLHDAYGTLKDIYAPERNPIQDSAPIVGQQQSQTEINAAQVAGSYTSALDDIAAQGIDLATDAWDTIPEPGQRLIITALEYMDKPRQWNSANIGNMFYEIASDQAAGRTWYPPTWLSPAIPLYFAMIAAGKYIEANPEFRDEIIAAHDAGGGAGVWENALISKTEALPWYIGAPLRFAIDFTIDPLGLASFALGGAGAGLRASARELTAIRGASTGARTMNAAGHILESGERLQNLPFDAVATVGRAGAKGASKISEYLAGDPQGLGLLRVANNPEREAEVLAEQVKRGQQQMDSFYGNPRNTQTITDYPTPRPNPKPILALPQGDYVPIPVTREGQAAPGMSAEEAAARNSRQRMAGQDGQLPVDPASVQSFPDLTPRPNPNQPRALPQGERRAIPVTSEGQAAPGMSAEDAAARDSQNRIAQDNRVPSEPSATPDIPVTKKTVGGKIRMEVGEEKGLVRVLETDTGFQVQVKRRGKWANEGDEVADPLVAEGQARQVYRRETTGEQVTDTPAETTLEVDQVSIDNARSDSDYAGLWGSTSSKSSGPNSRSAYVNRALRANTREEGETILREYVARNPEAWSQQQIDDLIGSYREWWDRERANAGGASRATTEDVGDGLDVTPPPSTEPVQQAMREPFQPPRWATLTPEERKAAIADPNSNFSEETPQWNGKRSVDKLYRSLMEQGRTEEWDRFVAAYNAKGTEFREALASNRIPDSVEWGATNDVLRAEHMADDFVSAYAETFGVVPPLENIAARNIEIPDAVNVVPREKGFAVEVTTDGVTREVSTSARQATSENRAAAIRRDGIKKSFAHETPQWLIQRAVFGTSDSELPMVLNSLRQAWPDAPWADRLLGDIRNARARLDAQRAALSAADRSGSPLGIINRPDSRAEQMIDQRMADDIGDTSIPPKVKDNTIVGWAYNGGAIDHTQYTVMKTPLVTKDGVTTYGEKWAEVRIKHGADDIEGAEREMQAILMDALKSTSEASRVIRILKATDRAWMNLGQHIRANIQYNIATGIRGPLSDQIGDFWQLLVAGSPETAFRTFNPKQMIHWWQMTRGEKNFTGRAGNMENAFGASTLYNVGKPPPIHQVARYNPRSDVGNVLPISKTTGKRNRFVQGMGGIIQNKWIHDFRQALDTNRRWTAYIVGFKKELAESRTQFAATVREQAQLKGKSVEQEMAKLQSLGAEYSVDDVRRVFNDDDLTRKWANLLGITEEGAKDFEDSLLFSYTDREVDKVLRHGFFFHYWQTRALGLHARATLTNWPLMTGYARAWQGLEEEADKRGFPPSLKGYIKFMGSYGGLMGLISPIAFLTPFSMFEELARSNGEGVKWDEFVKGMVFLNPMVEAAAAALGYEWGSSTPNVMGIRAITRDMTAIKNFGAAHGVGLFGKGYSANAEEKAVSNLLNRVSEAMGTDYKAPQVGAGDIVRMRAMVATEMQGTYGPMNQWSHEIWDEFLAAEEALMTGADNRWATPVFKEWSNWNLGLRAMQGALPGVTTSYGPLNAAREDAGAGYDAIRAGEQPNSQQQSAMAMTAAVATGSSQAATLKAADSQYHAVVGSDWTQAWSDIAHGDVPDGFGLYLPDGTWLSGDDIEAMSAQERMDLADAWVDQHHGRTTYDNARAEQDRIKGEYPEYAAFKDYQGKVAEYPGGAEAFAAAASDEYPAFAAAAQESGDPAKFAMSMDGYLAINGERSSIYDEQPPDGPTMQGDNLSAYLTADAGSMGDSNEGGGAKTGTTGTTAPKKDYTADNIYEDMALLAEEQATYQAQVGAAGWDITSRDPYATQAAANRFGEAPKPTSRLRRYLTWAGTQPPGADTSVEAYAAYVASLKEKVREKPAA